MILAVSFKLVRKLSQFDALDVIEKELCNLRDIAEFVNNNALMSWELLIKTAFILFLLTDLKGLFKNCQWEELTPDESGLILFLEAIKKYTSWNIGTPIRGPGAFALDFYQQSGGSDQLALFLFGKASQHV